MNIFVTGGNGFIGRHLVSSLVKEGHIVYVLTRDEASLGDSNQKNTIQLRGDLENPASYKAVFDNHIDIVYHLAAIPGQKWKFTQSDYRRINVEGTRHLLELSRKKIKKFIFCSSINAIKSGTGFRNDPYGKSKYQAEILVKRENSFETIILRPAIVYGPYDTGGMFLKMCRLIKKDFFFIVGSGRNIIPVIYIDDLTRAFLKAKDISKNKQAYEIVGQDSISIEKIATIIANRLGTKIPKWHIPIWIARLAALLFSIPSIFFQKEPIITNHRVDIVTKNNPLSFKKAQEELGFTPQMDFANGIDLTIKWYKKNGLI